VYEGRADKTRSGLTKKDLCVSKSGKIVSRRASRAAKARQEPLKLWRWAVEEAAEGLGMRYSIPVTPSRVKSPLSMLVWCGLTAEEVAAAAAAAAAATTNVSPLARAASALASPTAEG